MSEPNYQITQQRWARMKPLYELLLAWVKYRTARQQNSREEPDDQRDLELAAQQLKLRLHSIDIHAGRLNMSTKLQDRIHARAAETTDLMLEAPIGEARCQQIKMFADRQADPLVEQIFASSHSVADVLKIRVQQLAQHDKPQLDELRKLFKHLPELPITPVPQRVLLPLLEHDNRKVRRAAGRMTTYFEAQQPNTHSSDYRRS